VSTVGIFLPAFLYVAFSRPWLAYLKSRPHLRGALDGFNCASLALLITATLSLGQTAVVDFTTAIITVLCSLILLTLEINSIWLVLAGAVLGLGVHYA
jgi:chromate transporter